MRICRRLSVSSRLTRNC